MHYRIYSLYHLMREKKFLWHTRPLWGGGGGGGGGGGRGRWGGVVPCVPLPWYSTDKIDN